jgi:putative methyltransferase (TIGR04325 family)
MRKLPTIAAIVDTLVTWAISGLRRIRRIFLPPLLDYAPLGWETQLEAAEQGWLAVGVLAEERHQWDRFADLLRSKGPLGVSHEASLAVVDNVSYHNINYTFGYVVMKAAFGRERLSVLDWGGGLGYYYLLAKALLPGNVRLDYHCKDVATLVQAGRELAPEISWHQDDACLGREYDLVMVSGSLQYCREWRDFLKQVRKATGRYFFLTRTPVVQRAASFVAVQRAYGTRMLHLQFNEDELLAEIEKLGFELVREVVVGDPVDIRNAPEQAVLKGWLFAV